MSFFDEVLAGLDPSQTYFKPTTILDENKLSQLVKFRKIYPQSEGMKNLQGRLIAWLRKKKCDLNFATGAVPGGSTFVHVRRHRRKAENGEHYFPRYFYVVDLKNAFTKVNLLTLGKILSRSEFGLWDLEQELAAFLIKFCSSEEGGLATGASASPDLFNIYCSYVLDYHYQLVLDDFDLRYTRYLDDLIFSSNKPIGKKKKKFIKRVIVNAGFEINQLKTKQYDLTKGSVVLNGVGIDIHGRMFSPKWFMSQLNGLVHKCMSGKGDDVLDSVVRGKIHLFLRTLRECGKRPNRTETKLRTSCIRYLNWRKAIRTAQKDAELQQRTEDFWDNLR